jgi:putative sigma-54 modulation protein
MKINIRHHGLEVTREDKAYIVNSLEHALGRLDVAIMNATVFLCDINGPRGGIDKECRVLIHLNRGGFLAVEDADDNMSRLIDRIAERAGQSVVRHVKKHEDHRTRHREPHWN